MKVANIRALFPGLTDTIYFNTATMAVGCAPAKAAIERAVERWSAGRFDWIEAERAGDDARAMFAQIVGAAPEDVAIVPSVSAAAGIVAANILLHNRGEHCPLPTVNSAPTTFPGCCSGARIRIRTVPAEAMLSR
jgi:selenocysteine lyase/cysteine desulfurase